MSNNDDRLNSGRSQDSLKNTQSIVCSVMNVINHLTLLYIERGLRFIQEGSIRASFTFSDTFLFSFLTETC